MRRAAAIEAGDEMLARPSDMPCSPYLEQEMRQVGEVVDDMLVNRLLRQISEGEVDPAWASHAVRRIMQLEKAIESQLFLRGGEPLFWEGAERELYGALTSSGRLRVGEKSSA